MTQHTYRIGNMDCANCAREVETGVRKLAGVQGVRVDFATGKIQWEYFPPSTKEALKYTYSGLLATGGGLVFGAEGGSAFALDSDTGKELWRVFLGGDTRAAPISFTVDGRQVVAISAGRSLYLFELKP